MTGLDVEKDQILEMACLITDCDLNVLAEVSGTPRATPAAPRRFQGMLEQSNAGRSPAPAALGSAAPHRERASGTGARGPASHCTLCLQAEPAPCSACACDSTYTCF